MKTRSITTLSLVFFLSFSACGTVFENPLPAEKEYAANPKLDGVWRVESLKGEPRTEKDGVMSVDITTIANQPWKLLLTNTEDNKTTSDTVECIFPPSIIAGAEFFSFLCVDNGKKHNARYLASYLLNGDTLTVLQLDPKIVRRAIEDGKLIGDLSEHGPTKVNDSSENVLKFIRSQMGQGLLVEFAVLKRK